MCPSWSLSYGYCQFLRLISSSMWYSVIQRSWLWAIRSWTFPLGMNPLDSPKSWNQVMIARLYWRVTSAQTNESLSNAVASYYLHCSVTMMVYDLMISLKDSLSPTCLVASFLMHHLYDPPLIYPTCLYSLYSSLTRYCHTLPRTIYYHHMLQIWPPISVLCHASMIWVSIDSLFHFHLGLCVVPIGPQKSRSTTV